MALLLKPIQKASESSQTSVIVIDALDELDPPGKDDVPPILFDIASQLPENVKLIITSRPENSTVAALKASYTVTLHPNDSREEVAGFISSKLKAIGESRGWQEWPSTTQIKDLSAKADGLFHYAATAVGWIKQRVEDNGKAAKERVFDEVSQLGVGEPEKLYDLILKTWLTGDTGKEHSADDPTRATRLKYFPRIIGSIVVRLEPVSIRDITSILNIPEEEFDIENFFQQMRSVLIPGKAQDSGPAYDYACTQWFRHLELTYKEEPRRDSDITNMLETLQDSSVRAAWYSKINVLYAFIVLAKVGWVGMKVSSCCLGIRLTEPFMIIKKFGVDELHKRLDTILVQIKVCELNEAARMY